MDGAPARDSGVSDGVATISRAPWPEMTTTTGPGTPGPVTAPWPGFRGPGRDNVVPQSVPLARSWPQDGPPVLWSIELGQGHAGPAVRDGRVYLFDYDEENQRDAIRCLSLADAAEIWRTSYPQPIKRNHGVSRTVIALGEDAVVGLGPTCLVSCLDAETGALRWRVDLPAAFGTTVPGWYAGQCPLIDEGRLILAPAGPETLLVAIDMDSGEILWRTPNPHASEMSHSSITPMNWQGRTLYAYCGSRGAVGVDAQTGEMVWETSDFSWHTIAPSPLPLPENRLLFTAGYGAKAKLAEIVPDGAAARVEMREAFAPRVLGAEQHTPILYDNHIYAVLPKPRQELVCFDLEMKPLWASGKRFGIGPYLIADGLVFVLNDRGRLTLAEASPEAYRELAEATVLDGHDSWGPMALVDGRLILRDLTRMVCLDVSRDGVSP